MIPITSETVPAATNTTRTPDPISSEVTKLNAAIHSTTTTSALRITTAPMRRAALAVEADLAAGDGVGDSVGVFMVGP
jgi:hypothetical protein